MLNFSDFQSSVSAQKVNNQQNEQIKSTNPIVEENNIVNDNKNVLVVNPSQMVISKNDFAKTLAIVGAISGTIMFCIGKKRKLPIQDITKLQQELTKANETITGLSAKNNEQTKAIEELVEKLKQRAQLSTGTQELIETKTQDYRKIIFDTTSIYEEAIAPAETSVPIYGCWNKKVPFAKSPFKTPQKESSSFIQNLLNKFHLQGRVEIPLTEKLVSETDIEKAKIKPEFFDEIGKAQRTSMLKEYGNSANWSSEKIARDIIQNFYDGNNHNLDDIGFLVEKLQDGSYRIKISGNGVFDHGKLVFLGATSKKDPYDAGGFGEGVKVLSTCMINKGYTPKIRFGSADWELTFDEKDDVIRTTLNKAPEILNGNFVEFETKDESFAKNIIKALDYFKHSRNPDFNGLTFENADFGFRILEKDKKGNFYLTQRFEYGTKGAWEDNVEGLDVIFKRRPDSKIYKEITGHDFDTGRDRTTMHSQDIFDLTSCFAKNMSDDELLDSILSTQEHWFSFKNRDSRAIASFTKALIKEAKERHIGFDFSKDKICYLAKPSETVADSVRAAGYKIIYSGEYGFRDIGMPDACDIFKTLSNHKALEPTIAEARKLKVLEEALKVIQRDFEDIYIFKLNDIFSRLTAEDLNVPKEADYFVKSALIEIDDFVVDSSVAQKGYLGYKIFDVEKFNEELLKYLNTKIKNINTSNINTEENKKALKLLSTILKENKEKNKKLEQYAIQLEHLQIVSKEDVSAPRFIFDRTQDLAKDTLGEAIIESSEYKGHWIDRGYLNNGNFFDLLATWIHEICHKSGGDGTAEFTYKLTDILEGLLSISSASPNLQANLYALEKIFNEIK